MQSDAPTLPERTARGSDASSSPRRPALRQMRNPAQASGWMRRSVPKAHDSGGKFKTPQVFLDPELGKLVVSKQCCLRFTLSKSPKNGSRKIRSKPVLQSVRGLNHS